MQFDILPASSDNNHVSSLLRMCRDACVSLCVEQPMGVLRGATARGQPQFKPRWNRSEVGAGSVLALAQCRDSEFVHLPHLALEWKYRTKALSYFWPVRNVWSVIECLLSVFCAPSGARGSLCFVGSPYYCRDGGGERKEGASAGR